ncbi:cytochrome P450 [Trametes polyzona]|nr:cytochrome P450 [Trametes polyzona]
MTPLLEVVIGAIILYISWRFFRAFFVKTPWDNLPGPSPASFLSGNAEHVFGTDRWVHEAAFVKQYGRLFKIHGPFKAKWLYTYDPRAMHSIFVKDTDVFDENEAIMTSFSLLLGPGLLATRGAQHRRQRKMLNPVFSAKHMRDMTPTFNEIVGRLREAIAARVQDGPQELDMLNWMGRTALELIGQGGLGHSFDPLVKDVADEYAESVKAYFPLIGQMESFGSVLPLLVKLGPAWFRRKVAQMAPIAPVQHMIHVSDTMDEVSIRIYNEKKRVLESGDDAAKVRVAEGKDIMSVLLRENMKASEEDRLSDDEVIGQMSILVLAAMDTTSNALSRTLVLLAEHPEVQQKLREEILRARDDGSGKLRDLDYDEVMGLPYLDAVCRETLRRYPPVGQTVRTAYKDGTLPLSKPIIGLDGTSIQSIPVEKGTWVVIDILASNIDKDLWGEDADEWKPERWLSPLPGALDDARIPGVYSNLMTFIGGSRACIGFKFSQLEMKVVLASLLPVFKFEPSDKDIYWKAAPVAFPTVGKDSRTPEMPMKVSLL